MKKNIKKIIFIVVSVIVLILICIFSLSYTINKNNKYQDDLEKQIKENYNLKEEITYLNQYGNYYIFTTKNNVIVLNKEYKEILKEDIEKISKNKDNYELIYKTNKLMYEETITKENKVTYIYYDAESLKKIKETTLER